MAGQDTHASADPTMLFISVVVGATLMVLVWLLRRNKDEGQSAAKHTSETKTEHTAPKKGSSKSSKKKAVLDWKKTAPAPPFSHPELLTSLKGHTGNITSGSYSADGKHFISAADAGSGRRFDPGGRGVGKAEYCSSHPFQDCQIMSEGSSSVEEIDTSSVSSSSQVATSNAPSDTEDIVSSTNSKMTRRQRRNKNKKLKKSSGSSNTTKFVSPSTKELFNSVGKTEEEIYNLLLPLCCVVEERVLNGYPYVTNQGVHIFKTSGYSTLAAALNGCELVSAELNKMQHFDVQNKVDVDGGASSDYSEPESLEDLSTGDGFHDDCQESSSGISSDSKEGECEIKFNSDVNMNYCQKVSDKTSRRTEAQARFEEKCAYKHLKIEKCKRCRQQFIISDNGLKPCQYHPKKLVIKKDGRLHYQCCSRMKGVEGCTKTGYHVYHHLRPGLNGPLEGYTSTKNGRSTRVFGLDCEMVYTTKGFELARLTLVSISGKVVLDKYVKPEGGVFDYNTQFSGITESHMDTALSFHVTREKILNLVSSNSILVGHSLEGDLSALRLVHRNVIDTALVFPTPQGSQPYSGPLPYKQALKSLTKRHLGRDIQKGGSKGHDSLEDATAALDLVLKHLSESQRGGDCGMKTFKVAPLPLALKNM